MKKLSKIWICPTCGNQFMAHETRDGLRAGRTCENGHFHSYYDFQRFEQGKPIAQFRVKPKREYKCRNTNASPAFPGVSDTQPTSAERDWYLAMLWVGAYDRLMSQLPQSGVVRGMVEGALETAYKASKKLIDNKQVIELRKAA